MTGSALTDGSADAPARAGAWELVAALLGSLLVLPAALYGAVLGASDDWSETVTKAFFVSFPLVAWGVVAGILVHYWREGWARLWTLPLVVFVGFVFPLALVLLITPRIRRSVLPRRPPPPGTTAGAPRVERSVASADERT